MINMIKQILKRKETGVVNQIQKRTLRINERSHIGIQADVNLGWPKSYIGYESLNNAEVAATDEKQTFLVSIPDSVVVDGTNFANKVIDTKTADT